MYKVHDHHTIDAQMSLLPLADCMCGFYKLFTENLTLLQPLMARFITSYVLLVKFSVNCQGQGSCLLCHAARSQRKIMLSQFPSKGLGMRLTRTPITCVYFITLINSLPQFSKLHSPYLSLSPTVHRNTPPNATSSPNIAAVGSFSMAMSRAPRIASTRFIFTASPALSVG